MDFDAIESGLLCALCGRRKLRHDDGDVRLVHHLYSGHLSASEGSHFFGQKIAQKVTLHRWRQAGCPDRLVKGIGGITGNEPAMVQLCSDFRAVAMHPFGQRSQAGQETIVRNAALIGLNRTRRPRDTCNARNNEPRPAPRLLFMIGEQPFATLTVWLGQADPHGRHEDAVADIECPDPTRRE
jgi:hypothetical protein